MIGKAGLRLRAAADFGHNLDGERQLTLGADTGLRGYDPNTFDGTSRAVANVEWRHRLTGEFLHIAVLGMTAFVDGGKTWGARVGPSTDGLARRRGRRPAARDHPRLRRAHRAHRARVSRPRRRRRCSRSPPTRCSEPAARKRRRRRSRRTFIVPGYFLLRSRRELRVVSALPGVAVAHYSGRAWKGRYAHEHHPPGRPLDSPVRRRWRLLLDPAPAVGNLRGSALQRRQRRRKAPEKGRAGERELPEVHPGAAIHAGTDPFYGAFRRRHPARKTDPRRGSVSHLH